MAYLWVVPMADQLAVLSVDLKGFQLVASWVVLLVTNSAVQLVVQSVDLKVALMASMLAVL
jgi:hypothetical protein